ncbi:hypothetical protein BV133_2818 [Blastochloris viridis]|uniref:Uncharacterized protein n=1 Tax=Blastochloris viridis TaxID=1079 RepID=A0A182D680_BLAVI|nr:hypothetical protein BV133_2818 [Blastochloris viridis]
MARRWRVQRVDKHDHQDTPAGRRRPFSALRTLKVRLS